MMRLTFACLMLAFVVACSGGCSCVLHQLSREEIDHALIGPSRDDAVTNDAALGADVAWAGALNEISNDGRWVFDYAECSTSARHPQHGLSRTAFIDRTEVTRTGRAFVVRLKNKDVRELPSYAIVPVVGRTYVVYGRVVAVGPVPIVEVGRLGRVVELRIAPDVPELAALRPIFGYDESHSAARLARKPVVVFLPESADAAQSAVARYIATSLDEDQSSRILVGIDDTPSTWQGFRNVFHMESRGTAVPFVVIDGRGGRRAAVAGLDDPGALRIAVIRALKASNP